MKPLQAAVFIDLGLDKTYELTDEEIADILEYEQELMAAPNAALRIDFPENPTEGEIFDAASYKISKYTIATAVGVSVGELIKYFDRVAVLSADSAEDMMKERIRSDLKKALNGYKTLMEMRDGDDDMTVYLSMQNEEVISEMVLVSDSEMALIFIAGDMPVSELQRIIAEVAEEQ